MSDELSIPLVIAYDDPYRDANPWNVCDGKWGGFGQSYWRRAAEFGFARGDVIEWRYRDGGREWFRIWVDADKAWRDLTSDEAVRLPALKSSQTLPYRAPVYSPASLEGASALAAVLSQPLLQVIERAPVLESIFSPTDLDNPSHQS